VKKIAAFMIIFLFLPFSSLNGSNAHPMYVNNGAILYVGGTGPGNYTSIQEAINDAENGDTIYVYHGTYHEDLYIWKNISLIGENKNDTIIKLGRGEVIIAEKLRLLEIEGFTIRNGATVPAGAINIISCRNVNIEGCNFLNNFYSCIAVYRSINTKIFNCNFSWNLGGIDIQESFCTNIQRCNFSHTIGSIMTFLSAGNIIHECNIVNGEGGIWLEYSIFNSIQHCNFINMQIPAYFFNSFFDKWSGNYWNESRILPRPINGKISFRKFGVTIPWIQFDWHPATKPYEW